MPFSLKLPENLLLRCLPPHILASLAVDLEPIDLPRGHSMEVQGEAVAYAYFVESGFASRVIRSGDEQVEIGLVGYEGATGSPLPYRAPVAMLDVYVQLPGHGFRIATAAIESRMAEYRELDALLQHYAYVQVTQTAHTCLCNARFSVLERTARWLLMCHDRAKSDEFHITHDFLALMIGARRAGVTTEMHVLEGIQAIRNTLGRIVVRERGKLEEIAGASYGVSEAHYHDLIGSRVRPN